MTNYSDEQLMFSLIEKGDLGAFEELLTRYEPPLFLYIIRHIRDYHKAQDLFQETFYRIYKHRKSFNPNLKFSTWVYRIATNLCINEIKAKKNKVELSLDDSDLAKLSSHNSLSERATKMIFNPTTEETLIKKDLEERIKELLEYLPEKLRSIFILSKYQELSNQEIAEVLEMPLGTVKSRLRQGFKLLYEIIEKRGLIDEV